MSRTKNKTLWVELPPLWPDRSDVRLAGFTTAARARTVGNIQFNPWSSDQGTKGRVHLLLDSEIESATKPSPHTLYDASCHELENASPLDWQWAKELMFDGEKEDVLTVLALTKQEACIGLAIFSLRRRPKLMYCHVLAKTLAAGGEKDVGGALLNLLVDLTRSAGLPLLQLKSIDTVRAASESDCVRGQSGDPDVHITTLNTYYLRHHFVNHSDACAYARDANAPSDGKHMSWCVDSSPPVGQGPQLPTRVSPAKVLSTLRDVLYVFDDKPRKLDKGGTYTWTVRRRKGASKRLPNSVDIIYDGTTMKAKIGNTVLVETSVDLPPAEYLKRESKNEERFKDLEDLENEAAHTTKNPFLQGVLVTLALLALKGGSLNILFTG